MSEQEYIYKGEWEVAYLCQECGEYLSNNIAESHWGKPCHRCAQTGSLCPNAVRTARRFVCTKKRLFRQDLGYYEWSGKSSKNVALSGKYISNRSVFNPTMTIAAAGFASGLF